MARRSGSGSPPSSQPTASLSRPDVACHEPALDIHGRDPAPGQIRIKQRRGEIAVLAALGVLPNIYRPTRGQRRNRPVKPRASLQPLAFAELLWIDDALLAWDVEKRRARFQKGRSERRMLPADGPVKGGAVLDGFMIQIADDPAPV